MAGMACQWSLTLFRLRWKHQPSKTQKKHKQPVEFIQGWSTGISCSLSHIHLSSWSVCKSASEGKIKRRASTVSSIMDGMACSLSQFARKYIYGTLIFSTQACDRREGEHGVCRLAFPQSEFCQSATNLLATKVNIWVDVGCVAERDQRMLSLSWVLSLRAQCMELLERKAKVPSRCNVFPFSGLWSYYLTSSKIVYPSLILALGNPRVDLLSLDIEGAEYLVLQTLPWEKVPFDIWSVGMTYKLQVDIRAISVETQFAGETMVGSREDIHQLLISKGFTHLSAISRVG